MRTQQALALRKQLQQYQELLQRAKYYLEVMAMESFLYEEKYYECLFCESYEPETHVEGCLIPDVYAVVEAINTVLGGPHGND